MKIQAQLSKHANKCSALEPHADKRSALWYKIMNADTHRSLNTSHKCRYLISFWYEQTHAETCKAWDTCIHMQAFNTCMYIHSSNTCQMHTVTRSWQMQSIICETWESQYAWRLRGQTWTKHSYLLCCTWLWSKCADTQTFKACTFFVNHCVWQALHKAQNTNFLSQEGTCVQALKSYENLANHETTFQTHTHTHTHTQMQRALCSWCWISTGGIFSTFK